MTSMMSGTSDHYHLLKDDCELTESNEFRKEFADADQKINKYQLQKLKLLACAFLRSGVKDSQNVSEIYNLLKIHYAGDRATAASVLRTMLEKSGMTTGLQATSEAQELSSTQFEWRAKLIQYSDKAKKEKKVSKLVCQLCEKYEIDNSDGQFACPIVLFEHMIELGVFKPGGEEHLEKVDEVFHFCKYMPCMYDNHSQSVSDQ